MRKIVIFIQKIVFVRQKNTAQVLLTRVFA